MCWKDRTSWKNLDYPKFSFKPSKKLLHFQKLTFKLLVTFNEVILLYYLDLGFHLGPDFNLISEDEIIFKLLLKPLNLSSILYFVLL